MLWVVNAISSVMCCVRWHCSRLKSLLDTTGGKVAFGGETDEKSKYVSPTLLVDVNMSDAVMKEEVGATVCLFTVVLLILAEQ